MPIHFPHWLSGILAKLNQSMDSRYDRKNHGSRLKSKFVKVIILAAVFSILIVWIVTSFRGKKDNNAKPSFNIDSIPKVQFRSPKIVGQAPSDFTDPWYCDLGCEFGQPCEYKDEVDLRVIVMTFQRASSLEKCLGAIYHMDTLGDKVSVDIWVDRSKEGVIDENTVKTAEAFAQKWSKEGKKGRVCIHQQKQNAYIGGQWIDTWRPKENTRELGLILEDDVSISPHAYRWIKAAHAQYGSRSDMAGYTLQMEGTNFFAPVGNFRPMDVAKEQTAFMYPVIGTWGYAPHPRAWREFQEWYHTVRPNKDIKTDFFAPRVPGMEADNWYGYFLKDGRQETMWEMWHVRFTHDKKLFTLYSNMRRHLGRDDVVLSSNRMEKGLHYTGNGVDNTGNLLTIWNPEFVQFPAPSEFLELNYDGKRCTEHCCFMTNC